MRHRVIDAASTTASSPADALAQSQREEKRWADAINRLEEGNLSTEAIETLLGVWLPSQHPVSIAPIKRPTQRTDQSRRFARMAAGQKWQHFRRDQPLETMARCREARVKALKRVRPVKPSKRGGLRTEELCQHGDVKYYEPLLRSLWMPSPVGMPQLALSISLFLPVIRLVFEEILEHLKKQVEFSSGWRLFIKDLASEEELAAAQKLMFETTSDKIPRQEALSFARLLSVRQEGQLLFKDEGTDGLGDEDRINMEHTSRMAAELVLMMSAAAVCRQSLVATGEKGRSPVSKRPRRKPKPMPEMAAKRRATIERRRAQSLDQASGNSGGQTSVPLKRGRPKGTTKAVMEARRAAAAQEAEHKMTSDDGRSLPAVPALPGSHTNRALPFGTGDARQNLKVEELDGTHAQGVAASATSPPPPPRKVPTYGLANAEVDARAAAEREKRQKK